MDPTIDTGLLNLGEIKLTNYNAHFSEIDLSLLKKLPFSSSKATCLLAEPLLKLMSEVSPELLFSYNSFPACQKWLLIYSIYACSRSFVSTLYSVPYLARNNIIPIENQDILLMDSELQTLNLLFYQALKVLHDKAPECFSLVSVMGVKLGILPDFTGIMLDNSIFLHSLISHGFWPNIKTILLLVKISTNSCSSPGGNITKLRELLKLAEIDAWKTKPYPLWDLLSKRKYNIVFRKLRENGDLGDFSRQETNLLNVFAKSFHELIKIPFIENDTFKARTLYTYCIEMRFTSQIILRKVGTTFRGAKPRD